MNQMAKEDLPVICPSIRECDAKHSVLNWVLAIAATILIAVTGAIFHKTDSIQTDVSSIKVSIQRLEDYQIKLAEPAQAPIYLVSKEKR